MLQIPGYSQLELIQESPRVLIYRARSVRTSRQVVLKILRSEHPNPEEINQYESEFSILSQNIGLGVPKAYELLQIDKTRVMILEDIGGINLLKVLQQHPLEWPELVDIALKMVHALSEVHSHGIIHCDLKPDNIIYNRSTGQIQIIDFGLASKDKALAHEKLKTFRGTLQYISPEQTGRMMRTLDYRSDYYTLGVTLYQLLAGRLPFEAKDPMEWMHCHIAQVEKPLHEVNTKIPPSLSAVVQKLMKKSPELRYQSAVGLTYDLKLCQQNFKEGQAAPFELGSRDLSAEFRLSNKLYGRENEIRFLKQTLTRTMAGGKKLVLIDGDPGVGKSTLVNIIRENLGSSQGYFIYGKYDQFRKEVPFSALIYAFNHLVRQILTESDRKISEWKERIVSALGDNAGIVTEVIPPIEAIIGKQAEVPAVSGNELRQRFQLTFHNFIRACCVRGQPLVIFLDDLQWADSASRTLIHTLLTEEHTESLLFIGAYRHREVEDTHPLNSLFDDLKEKKIEIDRIPLRDLLQNDIENLIQDSFGTRGDDTLSLAELIYEKTQGNPFFVTQFLKDLYEKKHIYFAGLKGWSWNLDAIKQQEVTNNVLTLMIQKIEALPINAQSSLQLAACFGSHFKIDELKTYNQKTDYENTMLLEPALNAGLIVLNDGNSYKFIHDRVQEAAYSLLSETRRQEIHWTIAHHLLKIWPAKKVQDGVFYLVNHWNNGATLIASPEDREKSAELNLLAAVRAKSSSVYELALSFSNHGLELLKSSDWKSHQHLLKSLHLICGECEYILGRFDRAESLFRLLLKEVSDSLEKARIYKTMCDLAYMKGRYDESIKLGILALKTLGFHLPLNPGKIHLLWNLFKTHRGLKKVGYPNVVAHCQRRNERDAEILNILTHVGEAAYFVNKNLFALIAFVSSKKVMDSGVNHPTPLGLFAAILWQKFFKLEEAQALTDSVIKLADNLNHPVYTGRSLFLTGGFVLHVTKSLKDAIKTLEKAYHMLIQGGDLAYGSFTAFYLTFMTFLRSRKLEQAGLDIAKYQQAVQNTNDKMIADCLHSISLLQQSLTGKTLSTDSFSTTQQSEAEWITKIHQHQTLNPRAWFAAQKILSLYILGHKDKALQFLEDAKLLMEQAPFNSATIVNKVICSLLILESWRHFSFKEKIRQSRHLKSYMKSLKALAAFNPQHYSAAYYLVLAEKLRVKDKYDEAIKMIEAAIHAAQKGEILLYQALAGERAAQIFFDRNIHKVGLVYLREALFVYENWGATAKVQSMKVKHPELIMALPAKVELKNVTTSSHSGSLGSQTGLNLDLDTVLKATNSLISEMDLNKLMQKLLATVIENAGAERAVLILRSDSGLQVTVEVSSNKKDHCEEINTSLEKFESIAHSIVTYVARTQETIVLDCAHEHDRFNRDPYVQQKHLMSVMCVPLISKGELKGSIYLEHNNSRSVFSTERTELIRVLAGQAVISLENARLYQQQVHQLRMQNELATAQAVQENLFPKRPGNFDSVAIRGFYQPASECSGDWWYYSDMGEEVYVWAGDVTGHGAPAALVTSAVCSAVSVLENIPDLSPTKAMNILNHAVHTTTHGRMDMTFFVGALNKRTGLFRYAKASHDAPLWLRKKNLEKCTLFPDFRDQVEYLMEPNGPRLGANTDQEFVEGQVQMEPGDVILLYTDGLLDMENAQGRSWGDRAFLASVQEAYLRHKDSQQMLDVILQRAQAFRQQTPMRDDVTLCVLQFKGAAAAAPGKPQAA